MRVPAPPIIRLPAFVRRKRQLARAARHATGCGPHVRRVVSSERKEMGETVREENSRGKREFDRRRDGSDRREAARDGGSEGERSQ